MILADTISGVSPFDSGLGDSERFSLRLNTWKDVWFGFANAIEGLFHSFNRSWK
jgi:hypothetical protein